MRMNSYFTTGSTNSSGAGITAFERIGIGAIADDEELAVAEPIRAGRIGRARQRHRERAFSDFVFVHVRALRCCWGARSGRS